MKLILLKSEILFMCIHLYWYLKKKTLVLRDTNIDSEYAYLENGAFI